MSAPQKKARSPRRTSAHRVPIGLQIAARALDAANQDASYILKDLTRADVLAVRLLSDPLINMENEGANVELGELANGRGAEKIRNQIAAAIPESVTHDPHALITDLNVCWQNAGLYLGLCLGFRIATGLDGK